MGVLDSGRVFDLVVPDDWTARREPGPGNTFTLDAPAAQDITVTIAVYRAPDAMREQGSARLVRGMAERLGVADPAALRVASLDESGQDRSFTRFDHEGRSVLAAFLIFPRGAVVATASTAVGDRSAFAVAERLVAGIAPAG